MQVQNLQGSMLTVFKLCPDLAWCCLRKQANNQAPASYREACQGLPAVMLAGQGEAVGSRVGLAFLPPQPGAASVASAAAWLTLHSQEGVCFMHQPLLPPLRLSSEKDPLASQGKAQLALPLPTLSSSPVGWGWTYTAQ